MGHYRKKVGHLSKKDYIYQKSVTLKRKKTTLNLKFYIF